MIYHQNRFQWYDFQLGVFKFRAALLFSSYCGKKRRKFRMINDMKQSLLELVVFYNEGEAVEDGDRAWGVMPGQSPWISDG